MIPADAGKMRGQLRPKPLRLSDRNVVEASPPPGYELREGVERFLRERSSLRPFLYETGGKLREYFGSDTLLAVECFVDPESSSAPVELFLLVKTHLEVDEARERLRRFEQGWWLDNMQRGDYLLNVSLEFV